MRFIICILLAILVYNCITGATVYRFTNYVCKSYNESWFKFHQCRLKALSREKVALNLNGTIFYPAKTIHVHTIIYKRASGYKPWIIDLKFDVCRFLRKSYDPFAKLIFNLFKEFSNFNHTCPYLGPALIKGFYLRSELLPLPWPTGEYLMAMRWSFDHRIQFDTNASFAFIEDLRTS